MVEFSEETVQQAAAYLRSGDIMRKELERQIIQHQERAKMTYLAEMHRHWHAKEAKRLRKTLLKAKGVTK